MRGVLDTSVVIAREVRMLPDEAAISAATLAELHFGVYVARNDEIRKQRIRRLTEIESRLEALPVDGPVARAYGELAHSVAAGRKARPRIMDILIAATACVHGAPLFTRNEDDFTALGDYIDIQVV